MGLGVNRGALGARWGAARTRGTPRAARRDLRTPKAHLSARSVSQARGWRQKGTCPMRTLGGPARVPYRGVRLPLHHRYTLKRQSLVSVTGSGVLPPCGTPDQSLQGSGDRSAVPPLQFSGQRPAPRSVALLRAAPGHGSLSPRRALPPARCHHGAALLGYGSQNSEATAA